MLDAGLDPDAVDHAFLYGVRVVMGAMLSVPVVGAPFVAVNLQAGRTTAAAALATLMVLSAGTAWLLRRTHRLALCGSIATALMFVHLVVVVAELRHPALFYWFYLIPLMGAAIGGLASGWLWTGMVLAVAAGLRLLPPDPGAAEVGENEIWAIRSVSTLALGVFMSVFVVVQRMVNRQLRDESQRVRLMQQAAVAANEAADLEEALRTSIERVCALTPWSLGHALASRSERSGHGEGDPGREAVELWHDAGGSDAAAFVEAMSVAEGALDGSPVRRGRQQRAPLWIGDLEATSGPRHAAAARAAGLRSGLVLPVMVGDERVAVLEFYARRKLLPDPAMLEVMAHVANQVAHAAERKQAERRIRALAYFDGLTGLPNRQFFEQKLEQTLAAARRSGHVAALLFVDLDGFKGVNDSLGHAAGDAVLQEVARRLMTSLRPSDTVARPGVQEYDLPVARLAGDEFTVTLPRVADPSDAAGVARRLLREVACPFVVAGREVYPSASIGIALFPDDGEDADTLLAHADDAMYHAKAQGRNRFQYYQASMNAAGARRLEIESALRRALEDGHLSLAYQPLRDAADARLTGAEVLLRWDDPELGPVDPAEFIPVAEETGMILPIGEWVLRTACAQMAAWIDAGHSAARLSVNISGHQIRTGGLADLVESALADSGLPALLLELELTESTIMRDDETTRTTLARLAELGVGVALDDFGVGYSSLSYLRNFPIGRLKVDRSFVRDIPTNPDDGALTAAIIALAHGLRIDVVAEGVETEEQARFLTANGCDELQGSLFSRPVCAAEFEGFLDREKGE
ncbi:MAG: putative bifunctional diguanylate cyclase/phosphodiesterase [Myxococcota bacterium]